MKKLMNEFFQIFSHAEGKATKSTVITPLTYVMAVILASLAASMKYHAPTWVLISTVVMAICILLIFFITYFYCLFKNPDLLRSEKYVISKMALEKTSKGDSNIGLITSTDDPMILIEGEASK